MKEYLEANHDAFCVSCDYLLVDNHENTLERKYAEKDNISCGIMYRNDLLIQFGAYDASMRHREEEDFRSIVIECITQTKQKNQNIKIGRFK